MEKNLPFVSLSLADKGYNKIVIPFLGKLDDGNVFKKIIILLLTFLAICLLLGGIYLSIDGLFGDSGFIKRYISNEYLSGGKKSRCCNWPNPWLCNQHFNSLGFI